MKFNYHGIKQINNTIHPSLIHYGLKDCEVLHIIGNSFDIAHCVASRYSDFERFVRKYGQEGLVSLTNTFFSRYRDVWHDMEIALGEYDEDEILDFCKPDEEFDMDHSLRASAQIEDAPDSIFTPVLSDLKDSFVDWVNSIDIRQAKKMFTLSPESLYLTFNYTETLEEIYGIPSSNVLHIHGSCIGNAELIFGHNNRRELPGSCHPPLSSPANGIPYVWSAQTERYPCT